MWSPKTGHSTMYNLLIQIYNKDVNTHITSISLEEYEKYKDYTTILLFRNPYERLVSSFRHYIKLQGYNITFHEFVNNYHKYSDDHHVYKQCSDSGYKLFNLIINAKKKVDYILDTKKMFYLHTILSNITGKEIIYKIENVSNDKYKDYNYIDKNNKYIGNIKVNDTYRVLDWKNFYNSDLINKVNHILKEDIIFYDTYLKN
jgi:hypothetical protein